MAATDKNGLLEITHREFAKLIKLLDSIDVKTAMQKDGDGTSIKDVIAHRAHWIDLFIGWYEDGLAGKTVYFPAEGYKWNDLKRYNANLRERQSDMGWKDALQSLQVGLNKFEKFIEALSNEELYGGPMKGANNSWTPGRWAEAAGPSHFRSAAKYVRTVLKSTK